MTRRSMMMCSLLALLSVSGCDIAKDHDLAEGEVTKFHQKLDDDESTAIYRAAHPDLRKMTGEKEFVSVLDAVHRKLGTVQGTIEHGWQVNSFNLQTNVVMTYETKFEHGTGTEQFVYRVGDVEPTLVVYNINSADLITK